MLKTFALSFLGFANASFLEDLFVKKATKHALKYEHMPDEHQPVQVMFSNYFMNEHGMPVCEHLAQALTGVLEPSNVGFGPRDVSHVRDITDLQIFGGDQCRIKSLPYDEKVRVIFKNAKMSFNSADAALNIGSKTRYNGAADFEITNFDIQFILSFDTIEKQDTYFGLRTIPSVKVDDIDFQGPAGNLDIKVNNNDSAVWGAYVSDLFQGLAKQYEKSKIEKALENKLNSQIANADIFNEP